MVYVLDLEQLPYHHQLEDRSNSSRHNHECIGCNHEVMESSEESLVFVGLLNKGVNVLFEWEMDTDPYRSISIKAF